MVTAAQVIAGYNNADAALRDRLKVYLPALWQSAGSWRDADVDRLLTVIVPQVQAVQLRMANLTSVYVQAMAEAVDGRTISAVPVDQAMIFGARGVDPYEVYRRPATQMYTALSNGATLTDAVTQGANRLVSLALTDMQLAKTHQERASYGGSGYEYTMRTLTGRENCALCTIASTQRYNVKSLRPIHPGCDCGSKQVSAKQDPGQVINRRVLEQTHDAIEAEFGHSDRGARLLDGGKTVEYVDGVRYADYTDLIVTREHGELGPLLTWRDQHFTSQSDIDAL